MPCLDGIVKALTNLGAPSWRPVTDVVAGAIDRLVGQNLIAPLTSPSESPVHETSVRLAPTPAGWRRLPSLLRVLPLPAYGSDITYRLKVMGLDLLGRQDREYQISELAGHWQRVLALWERAQERRPCMQPSVRL